jgi:hypothetical protein
MKEVSQKTKNLTDIEDEIFRLLKKQLSIKVSLIYLSQENQYIFHLPSKNKIVLSKPFPDERRLLHFLMEIEAFIVQNGIKQITIVTKEKTAIVRHPFSDVKLIPFDVWSLEF